MATMAVVLECGQRHHGEGQLGGALGGHQNLALDQGPALVGDLVAMVVV